MNVSTDPAKIRDMTEGDSMIVDFTYSVKWKETTIPFERRMEKYSRYSFLPQHLEVCSLHASLLSINHSAFRAQCRFGSFHVLW